MIESKGTAGATVSQIADTKFGIDHGKATVYEKLTTP